MNFLSIHLVYRYAQQFDIFYKVQRIASYLSYLMALTLPATELISIRLQSK